MPKSFGSSHLYCVSSKSTWAISKPGLRSLKALNAPDLSAGAIGVLVASVRTLGLNGFGKD